MAEIVYQTDEWGGKKGAHYIEFKINGKTLQIIVDDDHANVIGVASLILSMRCCTVDDLILYNSGITLEKQDFRETGTVPVKDENHA